MARKKKAKEQQPKEKTYKIKVPVYTTSMLDKEVGLFEDVTYDDMIRFAKDRIAKYAFPLVSPTRNKTLMTVVKSINIEEVSLGSDKSLLLQISAYDTNFYDGYFEGDERIAITKNNKIGKESNYVLIVPRKKGLTADSYTCYFLMFVYEDPTKQSGEVSRLAKLVAREIIQVPIENIKLPIIMQELKDCKTIPELQIKFTSMYEADNDVDVKYVQYLQGGKLEKKEYGIYLYHYYVFIHGITTIHDLFFKLVAEICDIRISKHMIQWEELSKLLDEKGEHEIIRQLNEFYKTIKHHEKKRHTASHEGRLTHNLLDRYHITYIWSKVHLGNDVNENIHPEYTEGTNENKYLLGNTKSEFIGELEALIEAAISHTYSLFDLLLPKLIGRMPQEFLNKHRQKFMDLQMQMENINRVL